MLALINVPWPGMQRRKCCIHDLKDNMQVSEQENKNLLPSQSETAGHPGKESVSGDESRDDKKNSIVLDQDDLKDIMLTDEEVEAVTREETSESSSAEEKYPTD
jgi:hypothetical protein